MDTGNAAEWYMLSADAANDCGGMRMRCMHCGALWSAVDAVELLTLWQY